MTERSRRSPAGWLAALLVVGFAASVAWRLWLVRDLIAPAAHADEDGYLLAARALAGGAGGYSTENALFRRAGYPLLLSPIYWFTSDAFQVYRGAQLVNAVVNAATLPLAYLFARRVFRMRAGWALGAAALAATMPAVVFYSQFAMADAVLAPLALCWLLAAHAWLTRSGGPRGAGAGRTGFAAIAAAAGSGAAAGAIYLTHVRGLMVVLAHLLVVALLALVRRVPIGQAAVAGGAALAGAALDLVLRFALGDKIITQGVNPKNHTIDALTTVTGLARTATRVVGQFWYLSIGTWGLGAIALCALLLAAARRAPSARPVASLPARLGRALARPLDVVLLTTAVTTLLVAGASSLSLPNWDHRLGYYAYPRYIHFLFPIWLLAGLHALLGTVGRGARTLALGAAGIALGTGAITFAAVRHSTATVFLAFDSPETAFLGWDWSRMGVSTPTLVGIGVLAALVGVGAVARAARRARRAVAATGAVAVAGCCLVALHVGVAAASVTRISEPMVAGQYGPGTPRLVRDAGLHPGDIVAESVGTPYGTRYNHLREVWWVRVELFDHRKLPIPAKANVVIGPYDPNDPDYDWRPGPEFRTVAVDRDGRWAVWRRDERK